MGVGQAKDSPELKRKCETGELRVELVLPAAKFSAEWLDTKTACSMQRTRFDHQTGAHLFSVPAFEDDIALLVQAQ